MVFSFHSNNKTYSFDSAVYFDLSTPIRHGENNVNAYFLGHPKFVPFRAGDFVGSVEQGGACNCEDISFNAHGNGTHTECVGHISKEHHTINQCLKSFHHIAQLITVTPEIRDNGDSWVPKTAIAHLDFSLFNALVIRTMPNTREKLTHMYSGTNPTYLDPELTRLLAEKNIDHVILDLPSVDKEEDGGALLAHRAFWSYPDSPRINATITELAFIPDDAADGFYVLNLQIAPFESDASPSNPILYPIVTA
jgi:kynurenine formamidase